MTPRRLAPLLLAALALLPETAEPHAFLVKSSPARRAALNHPPERVELWFNEALEPAYSSVAVTNAADVRVDLRDSAVGPDDPRKLSVSLSALAPGRYSVSYRVLSVDGHVVKASFLFSVKER